MDVLGENEALQLFFEGHDVTGVLESPVVDTSMLERYLSNDVDPATLMIAGSGVDKILPDSPPDSGSEACSPPQIPDMHNSASWATGQHPQVPFPPAVDSSSASCRFKEGVPGRHPSVPQQFMGLPSSYVNLSAPPAPACLSTASSSCLGTAYPYLPPRPSHHPGAVLPKTKKRKHSDSFEGSVDQCVWNDVDRPKGSFAVNGKQCADVSGYDSDGQNDSSLTGGYQSLTWSMYHPGQWTVLCNCNCESLPAPGYHVDTDKGFNYSTLDEAFVCQKKNHFQVTVHIGMVGNPMYVKTPLGLKPIEKFYVKVFGIKVDAPNHIITVEQSQSDRSKKPFLPVKVSLPGDKVTKVTLGRLHFSETTTNNMRKKGKPNPDQRYFMLVVGLYAALQDQNYLVVAHISERIIVRASNPGQFENDTDQLWQRGHAPESVVCHGWVGINTDSPDEALVVCGNMKVMGTVMHPSDMRAKQNIQEVDTTEQLKRIAQMRIVEYDYKPEFALKMGIDQAHETGVIAQEVKELLPSAVKDVGDVACTDGETITNFLMVDKEKIFMENVGAVKQLCKLTDNLENRIQELEVWNKRIEKLKRIGSIKSAISDKSANRTVSRSSSIPPPRQPLKSSTGPTQTRHHCLQHRFSQAAIITLVSTMAFCVIAITSLYLIDLNNDDYIFSGLSNSSVCPPTDSTMTSADPTSSSTAAVSTTVSGPWPPDVEFCSILPCDEVFCCSAGAGNASAFSLPEQQAGEAPRQTGQKQQDLPTGIPRDTGNDQDLIDTTIKSIHIVENQQIIDNRYCLKQNCGDGNYSYVIPLSKHTPVRMRITLQMNSSEALVVYLCGVTAGAQCPDYQHRKKRAALLHNTQTRSTGQGQKNYKVTQTTQGFEHQWPLPVAVLYWSSYYFRATAPGQADCETDPNYMGVQFTDYYFYFYRRCD
ncbi:myelin regulatory factor-like protein isoform X2 [Polyodon spathula]|uniref:myelin regulatory factor-like protein isoform X2 n=1 Tax=Polyodon spathula TaxID=7913 RepID=UPI001B7DA228|nr:myelin regulatory factor-like protein isoform X2 [Polyodon spathula]